MIKFIFGMEIDNKVSVFKVNIIILGLHRHTYPKYQK